MLDLLGKAGCVSIEAGVESLTEQGRSLLAKRCKLTTDELTELLVYVRRVVPFVQANLLAGIANRISGHDVEARVNFRYVLLRKPDWQLDEQTPPKVALFFAGIRQELIAEKSANGPNPATATRDALMNYPTVIEMPANRQRPVIVAGAGGN